MNEFEMTWKGEKRSAQWEITKAQPKLLRVTSAYGDASTQLGELSPDFLARDLFRGILRKYEGAQS